MIQEPQLQEIAKNIRVSILKMLVDAGSGHSAGALGMADVFATLYFSDLLHLDPEDLDRDRVVLSNGHICPVLYATLVESGFVDREELLTLRNLNTRFQGHPHRGSLPGIETTSGPLGSGLSQAAGMAYGAKLNDAKWKVVCVTSDGEHQEGNTWEGVMFAAKYKLDNLLTIIDRNNIQIDGYTEDVMPLDSLIEKYEAFNWHVQEIDGHNYEEIYDAVNKSFAVHQKPSVIIARTIPGKGVEFMENIPLWHGKPPSAAETVEALRVLREGEDSNA